jgi:hypothetical protein
MLLLRYWWSTLFEASDPFLSFGASLLLLYYYFGLYNIYY